MRVCSWICVQGLDQRHDETDGERDHHHGSGDLQEGDDAVAGDVEDEIAVHGSDRHPHDVLVGRDHPVAHGDERLEGRLALCHCRHHVDDVGLAAGGGERLRLGGLAGLGDGVEGPWSIVANPAPAAGPAFGVRCPPRPARPWVAA